MLGFEFLKIWIVNLAKLGLSVVDIRENWVPVAEITISPLPGAWKSCTTNVNTNAIQPSVLTVQVDQGVDVEWKKKKNCVQTQSWPKGLCVN